MKSEPCILIFETPTDCWAAANHPANGAAQALQADGRVIRRRRGGGGWRRCLHRRGTAERRKRKDSYG